MNVSRNESLLCLAAILLIGASRGMSADEPGSAEWKPLFDGKTLNGWDVLEGEGKFFVENGAVVGESTAGVKGSRIPHEDRLP